MLRRYVALIGTWSAVLMVAPSARASPYIVTAEHSRALVYQDVRKSLQQFAPLALGYVEAKCGVELVESMGCMAVLTALHELTRYSAWEGPAGVNVERLTMTRPIGLERLAGLNDQLWYLIHGTDDAPNPDLEHSAIAQMRGRGPEFQLELVIARQMLRYALLRTTSPVDSPGKNPPQSDGTWSITALAESNTIRGVGQLTTLATAGTVVLPRAVLPSGSTIYVTGQPSIWYSATWDAGPGRVLVEGQQRMTASFQGEHQLEDRLVRNASGYEQNTQRLALNSTSNINISITIECKPNTGASAAQSKGHQGDRGLIHDLCSGFSSAGPVYVDADLQLEVLQ